MLNIGKKKMYYSNVGVSGLRTSIIQRIDILLLLFDFHYYYYYYYYIIKLVVFDHIRVANSTQSKY
jgi:hypothetical protein